MRVNLLHIALLLMAFVFVSCDHGSFAAMTNEMNPHGIQTVLADDLYEDDLLLDVRSMAEYKVSHIPGALWIGEQSWTWNALHNLLPENRRLVAYCSVGKRSGEFVQFLPDKKKGNAFNLWGGIFNWSNLHKQMQNADGLTNHIHPCTQRWAKWITAGEVVYE
jgi:rhodanese-related sulfurtransferase